MTIRPTPTSTVMTCDGPDCGQTHPADNTETIAVAYRVGWHGEHIGSGPDYRTEHHCPRCAAASRRAA